MAISDDCELDEYSKRNLQSHTPGIAQWMAIIDDFGWLKEKPKPTMTPLDQLSPAELQAENLKRRLSALAGYHEVGKGLFEQKLTSNDEFESWKEAVGAWRKLLLEDLNERDAVEFDAPFSETQRKAGHKDALNRVHGDMRGELLTQLERLRTIMGRHAT